MPGDLDDEVPAAIQTDWLMNADLMMQDKHHDVGTVHVVDDPHFPFPQFPLSRCKIRSIAKKLTN